MEKNVTIIKIDKRPKNRQNIRLMMAQFTTVAVPRASVESSTSRISTTSVDLDAVYGIASHMELEYEDWLRFNQEYMRNLQREYEDAVICNDHWPEAQMNRSAKIARDRTCDYSKRFQRFERLGSVYEFGRHLDLGDESDVVRYLEYYNKWISHVRVPADYDRYLDFCKKHFKEKQHRYLAATLLAHKGNKKALKMVRAKLNKLTKKDFESWKEDEAQSFEAITAASMVAMFMMLWYMVHTIGKKSDVFMERTLSMFSNAKDEMEERVNNVTMGLQEEIQKVSDSVAGAAATIANNVDRVGEKAEELLSEGHNLLETTCDFVGNIKSMGQKAWDWFSHIYEKIKGFFVTDNMFLSKITNVILKVIAVVLAFEFIRTMFPSFTRAVLQYLCDRVGLRMVDDIDSYYVVEPWPEDAKSTEWDRPYRVLEKGQAQSGDESPGPLGFIMELLRINVAKVKHSQFYAFCDVIPKVTNTAKALEWIFDHIHNIYGWLLEMWTGEVQGRSRFELDVLQFAEGVDKFASMVDSSDVEIQFSSETYGLEKSLTIEGKRLESWMIRQQTLRPFFSNKMSEKLSILVKKKIAFAAMCRAARNRPVPVWVYIHGRQGVGKSQALRQLMTYVFNYVKKYSDILPKDATFGYKDVFAFNQGEKFYDGYFEQFFTIIDDLFQIKSAEDRTYVAGQLINLISPSPYSLLVATPEHKAHTYFTSKCIISTSNMDPNNMGAQNIGLEDPRALSTRRAVSVEMVAKDTFSFDYGYEMDDGTKVVNLEELASIVGECIIHNSNQCQMPCDETVPERFKGGYKGGRMQLSARSIPPLVPTPKTGGSNVASNSKGQAQMFRRRRTTVLKDLTDRIEELVAKISILEASEGDSPDKAVELTYLYLEVSDLRERRKQMIQEEIDEEDEGVKGKEKEEEDSTEEFSSSSSSSSDDYETRRLDFLREFPPNSPGVTPVSNAFFFNLLGPNNFHSEMEDHTVRFLSAWSPLPANRLAKVAKTYAKCGGDMGDYYWDAWMAYNDKHPDPKWSDLWKQMSDLYCRRIREKQAEQPELAKLVHQAQKTRVSIFWGLTQCIGGVVMGYLAVRSLLKFFMPASAYKNEGQAAYEHSVRTKSRAIPQRVAKRTTGRLNALFQGNAQSGDDHFVRKKIADNADYLVAYSCPRGTPREKVKEEGVATSSWILFVFEEYALVPLHTIFASGEDSSDRYVSLTKHIDTFWNVKDLSFSEIRGDIALVKFPGMPLRKNIVNYFADDLPSHGRTYQIQPHLHDIGSTVRTAMAWENQLKECVVGNGYEDVQTDLVFHGLDNFKGMCGIPYIDCNGKIIALHMGGNPSSATCYGVTILLEDILPLYHTLSRKLGEDIAPITMSLEDNLRVIPGTTAIGLLPPGAESWMPTETSLRRSAFDIQSAPEPETKDGPAHLRPFKVIDDQGVEKEISPLKLALENFGLQSLKHKAPEKLGNLLDILPRNFNAQNVRVLTIEEAIYGIPGYLKSMDFSKSPGYFFKRIGLTRRKLCFDEDGNPRIHPVLLAQVERILSNMRDRGVHPVVFEETLKDEIRSWEKNMFGKTRLFSSGDFASLIVQRMYLGTFIEECVADPVNCPIALSINPHSRQWAALYARLRGRKDEERLIGAGDFSTYDISHKNDLIDEFTDLVCRFHPEPEVVRRVILANFMGWHICRAAVFERPWGTSSGSLITSLYNSFVNWAIHKKAFVALYSEDEWKFVETAFVGDDSIFSVPKSYSKYNMAYLQSYFAEWYQMKYTSPFKDDSLHVTWETCTFLKRQFVLGHKGVMAPLARRSLANMIKWCDKHADDQQMESVCNSALLEAWHYGPEYYQKWYQWCIGESRRLGSIWKLPTWQQMELLREKDYAL